PLFVLHMIWDANEITALTFDYGIGAVDLGFFLRMFRDIRINLVPGDSGRIEGAAQIKRIVADKRFVLFQQIVAAAIDHKEPPQTLLLMSSTSLQSLIKV